MLNLYLTACVLLSPSHKNVATLLLSWFLGGFLSVILPEFTLRVGQGTSGLEGRGGEREEQLNGFLCFFIVWFGLVTANQSC